MTSAPEQQTALTTTFSNIANNVVSQLAAACAATDVSITLLSGTGASFPAAPFYVSVEYEVLWCSNKTGDVLQVSRGVDGTTAAPHPVNSIIQIRNNAGLFLDAYDAIHELDNGIVTGSALPANVAYTDKVQELTHKTIDLVDQTKGNVIVGNVSPDPAQLVYENLIDNGGFEEWGFPDTSAIPAGTPTSGGKTLALTNFWYSQCTNDSAITCTRDANNTDPATPSLTDCLINLNTVQANDFASIGQIIGFGMPTPGISGTILGVGDFGKLVNNPISVSVRTKSLTGSVQLRLRLTYWDTTGSQHDLTGAWTAVPSTYSTIKLENQVWVPVNTNPQSGLAFAIDLKGIGQIAVDSTMIIIGAVSTTYRPKIRGVVNLPNHLVNGGFEVWQRGDGPFQNNGTFTCDRWRIDIGAGTAGMDIHKVGSNVGFGYAASVSANLGDGSSTFHFSQPFAGNDIPSKFANKILTFSAKVQSNAVNTVCVYIQPVAQSIPGGYTFYRSRYNTTTANTLMTITALIPWDVTTFYVGIEIAHTSAVVQIDDATLVDGSISGDFHSLQPSEDLARCMRYYEIIADGGNGAWTYGGYNSAGASFFSYIPYKVTKGGNASITVGGAWGCINCNQPTVPGYNLQRGFRMDAVIVATGYAYFQPGATPANFCTAEYNP